jgi:hypothetical protein
MKSIFLLVVGLISLQCHAFIGFNLNDFSLLVGQQWKTQNTTLWSIDFQYEKYRKTCTQTNNFFGVGINHTFRNDESIFGVKLMWNPTKLKIAATRQSAIIPYLIGQFDYTKQTLNSTKVFKPGVGITGTFYYSHAPNIKASLQSTYAIPLQSYQNLYSGLVIECKIGIGINTRIHPIFKRNTENEINEEQDCLN